MISYDRLSLWGVLQIDDTVLDDMYIPDRIDRETVINSIILESAELELYYSDPKFLKSAVMVWSRKKIDSWERMLDALEAVYNPIENFDRHESWEDQEQGTKEDTANRASTNESSASTTSSTTGSSNGSSESDTTGSSEAQNETNVVSSSNSENNTEAVNKVNGFNDGVSSLTTHDKNEGSTVASASDDSSSTGSSTTSNEGRTTTSNTASNETESTSSGSNTGSSSESLNSSGSDSRNSAHVGHLHGNIGLTSNQDMVRWEVALRDELNIYDIITRDFLKAFCLRVY